MVRIGLYDSMNNHNSESKDSTKQHNSALEFYTSATVISPFSLVDIDGGDRHLPGGNEDERSKGEGRDDSKRGQGGGGGGGGGEEGGFKAEEDPENLSEIWLNFLSETSLHGCKNVKERQLVKRLVWSCFILLMAGTLTWALVGLFLKYQEHPFVSVWGFQREGSIPVPGLTICIPGKFNSHKLRTARDAYKLLAYGSASSIPLMEGGTASELDGYQKFFDIWKKELENITVTKARQEIGFTRAEVLWYSMMVIGNERFDLNDVMQDVEMDDKSCWTVNWLGLNQGENQKNQGGNESEEKEEEEEEEVEDDNDSQAEDLLLLPEAAMEGQSEDVSDETEIERITATEPDTDNTTTTPQNDTDKPTTSIFSKTTMISNETMSTSPTPTSPPQNNSSSTIASTSGPETSTRAEETRKAGHTDQENSDADNGEDTEMLRLAPSDSITFVMNIQQYNWLNTIYYSGVEIYIYDISAAFWTVNPLLIRPGTMSTVYYKTTKYKFLPLPYKSFGGIEAQGKRSPTTQNSGCVDTTAASFKTKMVSVPPELYSAELCMLEMAMNKSALKCGCSVEDFYNKLHGTKECSIYQYQECFAQTADQEILDQQRRLVGQADGEEAPCPQACRMTTYESSVTSANYPSQESKRAIAALTGLAINKVDENILLVSIKPQGPLTVTVEHVPELTILNILGSVGGWMGLCLGASFLTLTELFEAFALSAWILCRRLVPRLRS
ncbi:hypothetical protein EGW08_015251 [Elysia chlorotica]|uniref:Uncharacterized protein n=1 Tax=Elysia chlorotica TaxID=188477 RepID=A0A3S0ZKI4_ELYCH|nr:hypothetical protein EGW08_015251 [Elysia chlorotica]